MMQNKAAKEMTPDEKSVLATMLQNRFGNIVVNVGTPELSAARSLMQQGYLRVLYSIPGRMDDGSDGAWVFEMTDLGKAEFATKSNDDSHVETQKAEWVVLGGVIQHKAQKVQGNLVPAEVNLLSMVESGAITIEAIAANYGEMTHLLNLGLISGYLGNPTSLRLEKSGYDALNDYGIGVSNNPYDAAAATQFNKSTKATDASTILQDADQGIIIPETNPNYALAMQLVRQGLLQVTFDEFQQGDVWHTGTFTITPAGRDFLTGSKSTTKDLWDQFANDMTPRDYAELANIQDGLIARLMPMDPVKHGPLCAKLIALGLVQGDVDNPSTLTLTSLGQQLFSDFNNPEFKGKKSTKQQKSGGKYYDLGVRYASNPAYEGWNVNGLITTAINNHEFNEFTLDNDPTYSRFNAATDEFAQGVRDEWDRRTLNEPEGTNPYKQTKVTDGSGSAKVTVIPSTEGFLRALTDFGGLYMENTDDPELLGIGEDMVNEGYAVDDGSSLQHDHHFRITPLGQRQLEEIRIYGDLAISLTKQTKSQKLGNAYAELPLTDFQIDVLKDLYTYADVEQWFLNDEPSTMQSAYRMLWNWGFVTIDADGRLGLTPDGEAMVENNKQVKAKSQKIILGGIIHTVKGDK